MRASFMLVHHFLIVGHLLNFPFMKLLRVAMFPSIQHESVNAPQEHEKHPLFLTGPFFFKRRQKI